MPGFTPETSGSILLPLRTLPGQSGWYSAASPIIFETRHFKEEFASKNLTILGPSEANVSINSSVDCPCDNCLRYFRVFVLESL